MSESEASILDSLAKSDIRPDELEYTAKRENSQIATRLQSLFGNKQDMMDEEKKNPAEKDYETVDEPLTTDTATE